MVLFFADHAHVAPPPPLAGEEAGSGRGRPVRAGDGAGVRLADHHRFLWRELAAYYHAPLRPLPGDRLESQIMIDRPEIEGLIIHFWRSMRGARPAACLFAARARSDRR